MMESIQTQWNERYSQKSHRPLAALVLQQNQHLLPKKGVALDLACGQGGNALMLAKHGLDVYAWDLSSVAIGQLNEMAQDHNLPIKTQVRDVIQQPPTENSVDVLVISFFLERSLSQMLSRAIKPNGVLFYQTYCQQKVCQTGPVNPEYLLADNELLSMFPEMAIRVYREEALAGDHGIGLRNQAMLVAQKPSLTSG